MGDSISAYYDMLDEQEAKEAAKAASTPKTKEEKATALELLMEDLEDLNYPAMTTVVINPNNITYRDFNNVSVSNLSYDLTSLNSDIINLAGNTDIAVQTLEKAVCELQITVNHYHAIFNRLSEVLNESPRIFDAIRQTDC